jgi:hypothetical protein
MINEEMTNQGKQETSSQTKISLGDIMYMIENGINPPGIQVYEDMPSQEKVDCTKSILTKKNKVIISLFKFSLG